jgi:hypothetical protein
MLQPILEALNKKNIVLASGSPRRKEIMTALVRKILFGFINCIIVVIVPYIYSSLLLLR